ncbi:MAG: porin, partial [Pseudomonadota bacterium]
MPMSHCRQKKAAQLASGAMALLGILGMSTPSALADEPASLDVTGEISVVVGSVDGELKSDANAALQATTSTVFANGLELGAAASLRADADMGVRRPAAGRYSSLLSGGSRGFGPEGADVFLEGAYLFARGGFGSLHVGRDQGVASRLSVTSPTIFRAVGVNDWRTDLTGLNDVHTINDFSGQSTKVSYMPPAGFLGGVIGQLQLGVSYAPELSACGEDACVPFSGLALDNEGLLVSADQAWEDVLETALYYQNTVDIGNNPLDFGLSASYVSAEDNGATLSNIGSMIDPLFGDYQAYAFGLNLSYGNLTFGGSLKSTNAGLNEDR